MGWRWCSPATATLGISALPATAKKMQKAKQYGTLLFILSLLAGCNSYGIPAQNALRVQEHRVALRENCALIQVEVEPTKDEWQKKRVQQLRNELVSDLQGIHGIRVVDAVSPGIRNGYLLTLRPTPFFLNEPMIAVVTIGLVPQPLDQYTGYVFSVSDAQQKQLGDVDATHMIHDWFGWFVFLFKFSPTQTTDKELAKDMNRLQVKNDIISGLDKLGVFEGCAATTK
jgi:hypothetical protein